MYGVLKTSGRLRNMKVVVPSTGWVTTVSPAIQLGFEPILCESDRETFALDIDHLESLLKRHSPSAVILVHVLGVPARVDEVLKLKDRYGFLLMEDACAAIGASCENRFVGTFGDLSSFSFYFGHQMSTIEGGMVSTSDPDLHETLLMLRSHGWGKDLGRESQARLMARHRVDDFHQPFVFYEAGFNLRSTELNAFIGIGQIDKLPQIISRREENHHRYVSRLRSKLQFQVPAAGSRVCSIHTAALAPDPETRRRIVEAFESGGVETRLFTAGNLGLHPFWTGRYGESHFPNADRIYHTGFFFPNHPSLGLPAVDEICALAKSVLG